MNTTNMFNHAESIASSLAALGFYTIGKIFGIVPQAAVALKDTWHFQALQEIAFAASIIAAAVAVITLHRNIRKDKKK